MHFFKRNIWFLAAVLMLGACDDGREAAEREQAFLDSIAAARQVLVKDSIALSLARNADTSITIFHARYLDFEVEDALRIIVKDDSGNMRKFLINPMMPAAEWMSIQKPSNRGEWMLLEFRERDLMPINDTTPGEIVREVVKMKMLK